MDFQYFNDFFQRELFIHMEIVFSAWAGKVWYFGLETAKNGIDGIAGVMVSNGVKAKGNRVFAVQDKFFIRLVIVSFRLQDCASGENFFFGRFDEFFLQ